MARRQGATRDGSAGRERLVASDHAVWDIGMHILFVTHYALPHPGGIEFVVDQLGRRLSARGYTVTVIASRAGFRPGVADDAPMTVIRVPALNILERYGIPYPLFHPLRLATTLHRVLPTVDVIHLHGILYHSNVIAAWFRRRRTPIVLTEHVGLVPYANPIVNGVERLAFATLGRMVARRCDRIAVLNRRIAAEIAPLARTGTPIDVIGNGVDTALFAPALPAERERLRAKWNLTRPAVLFVGRLAPKKGLEIAAAGTPPEADLIVCGQGASQDTLPPNVRRLGLLPQTELAELYRAADVFVLPSEGEGFPLAVQEALASGLPVVVSDTAANREILTGDSAVFVERTPDAVRAAIRGLLDDPARRSALAEAGRALALAAFDWEHTTERYLEMYHAASGR